MHVLENLITPTQKTTASLMGKPIYSLIYIYSKTNRPTLPSVSLQQLNTCLFTLKIV